MPSLLKRHSYACPLRNKLSTEDHSFIPLQAITDFFKRNWASDSSQSDAIPSTNQGCNLTEPPRNMGVATGAGNPLTSAYSGVSSSKFHAQNIDRKMLWWTARDILVYMYISLVTRDQPYLCATIFKHFIYVCFQLLILMNENQLKLH